MEQIKAEVNGRVQGVGFRQFVKDKADELGISGQVKNNGDGGVSIIAQGQRKRLEKFIDLVMKGTLLSNISNFDYGWQEPSMDFDGFSIILNGNFVSDKKASFMQLGRNLLSSRSGSVAPRHVAIIPDGNRRWAKEKGLAGIEGHRKSAQYENALGLLEEAQKLGVNYLTFWAFSTENWKRDRREINFLFKLLGNFLTKFGKEIIGRKVRFRHLGRKDRLPKSLVFKLEKLEHETENFKGLNVQMCLDYGGRDEIVRAVNGIIQSGAKKIDEEELEKYLDTKDIPDPDLIIRTSGEKRTSGLMLFQSAYAELYFADCYFPDFTPNELRKAITEFSRRKRNFGR